MLIVCFFGVFVVVGVGIVVELVVVHFLWSLGHVCIWCENLHV